MSATESPASAEPSPKSRRYPEDGGGQVSGRLGAGQIGRGSGDRICGAGRKEWHGARGYEIAFRIQASVPDLTGMSKEPKHVIDMYGCTPSGVRGLFVF